MVEEQLRGDGILLRRWRVSDAEAQRRAVSESAAHLRPWMQWMQEGPDTLRQRRARLASWEREWSRGQSAQFAIVVDGEIAGACGLHRRGGADTLEVGYWVHPRFLRRGIATAAARLLTDAAFTVPGIEFVEIHHDRANVASAGIPRRLGFEFAGEAPDESEAPAETGVDCTWRVSRKVWLARSD